MQYHAHEGARLPVLIIAAGRQRVGKTAFLNALIQHTRSRGSEAAIWNADQLNVTTNLQVFHADVEHPSSSDASEVKAWLEGRIEHIQEHRYDAILDVGGGEGVFSRLIKEFRISSILRKVGIRVVLVNLMGPDQADVDYLATFTAEGQFPAEDVMVVLNGGLIVSGMLVGKAFQDVRSHEIVERAIDGGAYLGVFPALGCMTAVTDRALSFDDALNGRKRDGGTALSFLDRHRVDAWWTEAVPEFFSQIPATMLPAMGAEAPAFAYRADPHDGLQLHAAD